MRSFPQPDTGYSVRGVGVDLHWRVTLLTIDGELRATAEITSRPFGGSVQARPCRVSSLQMTHDIWHIGALYIYIYTLWCWQFVIPALSIYTLFISTPGAFLLAYSHSAVQAFWSVNSRDIPPMLANPFNKPDAAHQNNKRLVSSRGFIPSISYNGSQ